MKKCFSFLILLLCWVVCASSSAEQVTETTTTILKNNPVPTANRLEISRQFGIYTEKENPSFPIASDFAPGETRNFFIIHASDQLTTEISAELLFLGESCFFWVDSNDFSNINSDFISQATHFDQNIIPLEISIFGSPEIADSKIHVVFTSEIGSNLYGYFSSRDLDHPLVTPYANGLNLIVINPSVLRINGQMSNTLAHEYQHFLHFLADNSEEVFIDEGLSGLAEYLSGTKTKSYYESAYLAQPQGSLTQWSLTESNYPNYGSSFLFLKYIADRIGLEFIRHLVQNSQNGMAGIDATLKQFFSDGHTEHSIQSTEQLFLEWQTTLMLNQANLQLPPYQYHEYELPKIQHFFQLLPCERRELSFPAQQYGLNLFSLNCPSGIFQITISGQNPMPLTPLLPYGESAWWSQRSSNSNAILETSVDLRTINAPVDFSYDLAYDLEEGFDFLYVSASTDKGKTWHLLHPAHGTDKNTAGFNLGYGYTGTSDGWIQESISLSQFSNQNIRIRFNVIHDQSFSGAGVVLQNLRLNAVGEDLPLQDWIADGFVYIQNTIPQSYSGVYFSASSQNTQPDSLEFFTLSDSNEYTIICDFSSTQKKYYFSVSAMNPFIAIPAEFKITIKHME